MLQAIIIIGFTTAAILALGTIESTQKRKQATKSITTVLGELAEKKGIFTKHIIDFSEALEDPDIDQDTIYQYCCEFDRQYRELNNEIENVRKFLDGIDGKILVLDTKLKDLKSSVSEELKDIEHYLSEDIFPLIESLTASLPSSKNIPKSNSEDKTTKTMKSLVTATQELKTESVAIVKTDEIAKKEQPQITTEDRSQSTIVTTSTTYSTKPKYLLQEVGKSAMSTFTDILFR